MHVERLTAAAEVQPGAESEPGKESWSRELGAYTRLRQEQTLGWQGGTSKQSCRVGSRVCLLPLWQLPWCGSEPVLRRVFKGFQTAPFLAGNYMISEQRTQYGKMKKLFSFPSLACCLKR